mgnify:CR=1 FL=1
MAATPRFYCATELATGAHIELPPGAARHVQVLRLQPGAGITLFGGSAGSGQGGEFMATVTEMGRQSVQVLVGRHTAVERETARSLYLAIGIPANERMDWLVEKATELGVAVIQPLMTERSVVRLDAQRGLKKLAHWQSITIAACEQCGRNRLPVLHQPMALGEWLRQPSGAGASGHQDLVLSLAEGNTALRQWSTENTDNIAEIRLLCGPEGGLSATEETRALGAGFAPVSLGPRVLRSETAALAALTLLA